MYGTRTVTRSLSLVGYGVVSYLTISRLCGVVNGLV
jgi:hypothetical protein